MRRIGVTGRPWLAGLLLLALVHAWTPRAVWHWHDCLPAASVEVVPASCALGCTHTTAPERHQPAEIPVWSTAPEPTCDFCFSSFQLPPLGLPGWGLLLLFVLGRLPVCGPPPACLVPVAVPVGRGRAPPGVR